ncbi:hypothetical protein V8J82_02785 [Gymnodinialimonas sp. 2305UL16-5]|uniref:hypothetical protein n=1 Tax=Gymnodinialimonas mytili TaxID=3126503 RepID=UPI0030A0E474
MRHLLKAILLASLPTGAAAQGPTGNIIIELNRAVAIEGACRLTFLAQNNMDQDIEQIVFETVLFTTEGAVDRLTLFDMGNLPAARPRVREFDMPGLACDGLGQVLINGVDACAGDDLDAATCEGALSPVSRVDGVEVIG